MEHTRERFGANGKGMLTSTHRTMGEATKGLLRARGAAKNLQNLGERWGCRKLPEKIEETEGGKRLPVVVSR